MKTSGALSIAYPIAFSVVALASGLAVLVTLNGWGMPRWTLLADFIVLPILSAALAASITKRLLYPQIQSLILRSVAIGLIVVFLAHLFHGVSMVVFGEIVDWVSGIGQPSFETFGSIWIGVIFSFAAIQFTAPCGILAALITEWSRSRRSSYAWD